MDVAWGLVLGEFFDVFFLGFYACHRFLQSFYVCLKLYEILLQVVVECWGQSCLFAVVVVLGVKDHLEVRDPKEWEQLREEKLAQQAEIMLRALGPLHPNSAWAQATIGVGLARADRIEQALPYLEKAVEMMVAGNGGPEHQAGVRRSLAVCLEKIGRVEQCVQVVQDLCGDQKALGDEDGLGQSQLWLKELESSAGNSTA